MLTSWPRTRRRSRAASQSARFRHTGGTAPRLARIVGHFRSALQIPAGVNAVCADPSLRRGGADVDVGQSTIVSSRACADGLRNDLSLSRGYGNCAHKRTGSRSKFWTREPCSRLCVACSRILEDDRGNGVPNLTLACRTSTTCPIRERRINGNARSGSPPPTLCGAAKARDCQPVRRFVGQHDSLGSQIG